MNTDKNCGFNEVIRFQGKIEVMDTAVNPYLDRISIKPHVRSGRPCVRDTRITVQEVLRWLASGATEEEILSDYPYLNCDDFKAVFAYAAQFPDPRTASL
jgi:uncharacterized protein (DUF433 family)